MADETITYIVGGQRVDPEGNPVAELKKVAARKTTDADAGDTTPELGEKGS